MTTPKRQDNEYAAYIEKEARSLGLIEDKFEIGKQTKPYDFEIDIEEALRSGVFISGGKGTTKSNLAMTIADLLMRKGVIVKAFDISGAWLRSSVPYIVEVGSRGQLRLNLDESVIFDLSRLTPKDVKSFVAKILALEWDMQVSVPEEKRKWICYVFEECQMLIPQGYLRSDEAQQVLRLASAGRNFKLAFLGLSPRPALCDTSIFELTFQRYFARMDGENDLKKVSNYIGREKAKQLQNLKLGQFIHDKGNEAKWITTKEFRSNTKPQRSEITQFTPSVRKQTNSNDLGILVAAMTIGSFMCTILAVLVSLGV